MNPLYDIPRNTRIDISHLGLTTDDEPVTEVLFKHVDGMAGVCEYNGEEFYLYADVAVKIIE